MLRPCMWAIRLYNRYIRAKKPLAKPKTLNSECKVRKKNRNNRQKCEKTIVNRYCILFDSGKIRGYSSLREFHNPKFGRFLDVDVK